MSEVAVIILNYKVREQTLKCVDSVLKSTYSDLKIIVVDNNSDDGIKDSLPKIKNLEFISSTSNLGYTGGNNLGILRALEEEVEFIFILNPDTTIEKDAIIKCVTKMKDQAVGIIGPKVLFSDQKTIWYAGGKLDQNNVLGSHLGVDEKDNGQFNKAGETDYVSGGAMFARSEVFKSIGLFDDRYFLYYEDSDFCLRAKEAGFGVAYYPQAVVYHANAQSTGLGSPLQDYFITRNRFLLASKFLSLRTQFALLREGLRNILNPVRRMAMLDFLLGRFGKGSFLR